MLSLESLVVSPILLGIMLSIQTVALAQSVGYARSEISLLAGAFASAITALVMVIVIQENAGIWMLLGQFVFMAAAWWIMLQRYWSWQRILCVLYIMLVFGLFASGGVSSGHAVLIWAMSMVTVGSVMMRARSFKGLVVERHGRYILAAWLVGWIVTVEQKRQWLIEHRVEETMQRFAIVLVVAIVIIGFVALEWRAFRRRQAAMPVELNAQQQAPYTQKGA